MCDDEVFAELRHLREEVVNLRELVFRVSLLAINEVRYMSETTCDALTIQQFENEIEQVRTPEWPYGN